MIAELVLENDGIIKRHYRVQSTVGSVIDEEKMEFSHPLNAWILVGKESYFQNWNGQKPTMDGEKDYNDNNIMQYQQWIYNKWIFKQMASLINGTTEITLHMGVS